MNPFKSNMGIAAVISVVALVVLIVGVRVVASEDPSITTMSLSVGQGGQTYCADFLSVKLSDDETKIVVTNCGNPSIAVVTESNLDGDKLASGEKFEVTIPHDDKFSVTIQTPNGEGLGGFYV